MLYDDFKRDLRYLKKKADLAEIFKYFNEIIETKEIGDIEKKALFFAWLWEKKLFLQS
jgi:hypothetical protein